MKHPKIWLGIGIGILVFLIVFLSCFYGINRINYQYDRKTDSYTVTGMYGQSSKIVIAGNINGKPVRKIASRAFYHNTHIEEVIFEDPSSLTEIDRLAFSGCSKLKEISLEEVQNIGRNAFEDCVSLEEVTLTVTDLLVGVLWLLPVEKSNFKTNGKYRNVCVCRNGSGRNHFASFGQICLCGCFLSLYFIEKNLCRCRFGQSQ